MILVLLSALIAGAGVALLRGGSFRRLSDLQIRLGWLALLVMPAQMYIAHGPTDHLEAYRSLHAILLLLTYALLVGVVWANRGIPGMPIVALGLLLNLVVMAANGGFMPVSREALLATGSHTAESLPPDWARLPKTKDVLMPVEDTRLWFLSDVIVARTLPVAKVYSLGDLVVGLGAFALFYAAMRPAPRRRLGEEGKVHAV